MQSNYKDMDHGTYFFYPSHVFQLKARFLFPVLSFISPYIFPQNSRSLLLSTDFALKNASKKTHSRLFPLGNRVGTFSFLLISAVVCFPACGHHLPI